MKNTIYLRAGQFTEAVLHAAAQLKHPLAHYHSCSPAEIEASRQALIHCAESAENDYVDALQHEPEHAELLIDLAVGLILPIPAIKDYVVLCGAYLGKADDKSKGSLPEFQSPLMKHLKLHSKTTWLVPIEVLKKQVIHDTKVRIVGEFGAEVLQAISLPVSEKFTIHDLRSCAFKEPMLTVLSLKLGFRRLYQTEVFFREDKCFPNEPVERTLATIDESETHKESEFVQAHLMPSYMSLLSCTLTTIRTLLKIIKAKGNEIPHDNELKWVTEQTEHVMLHFYTLYDSLCVNCGSIKTEGRRPPFVPDLLSRQRSLEQLIAKALHFDDEAVIGEFAKFRRLCPEAAIFNLKGSDPATLRSARDIFNKGISRVLVYGEPYVVFKKNGTFGIKLKNTENFAPTPGYTIAPVCFDSNGFKSEDLFGQEKGLPSLDSFKSREKAQKTLEVVNELKGCEDNSEVVSVGAFWADTVVLRLDEAYHPMVNAFKTLRKELPADDNKKFQPISL